MIEMILLDISRGWKTGIMVVLLLVVFYFFMIKPQSDKAKKEAAFRDGLKTGDTLITSGGIHVRFINHDGAFAIVEIAPGKRIRVQKEALQPVPERKKK